MADDAKRRILERRAQFVAAAIASIGTSVMAVSCEREPAVCLSAVSNESRDAGAAAPPPRDAAVAMPCLEPMPMPRDAEPTVCLSVALPPDAHGPIPIACLSPMPPRRHGEP